MKQVLRSKHCWCRTVLLLCALVVVAAIDTMAENPEDDLMAMSLDELLSLDVVLTTASKKAERIQDIPASVVVITRDDIARNGYTTLKEILQQVPGFYMIDDYYWRGAENFGVRGFFSTGPFNDIIILVNGVNQLEDVNGSYSLSKITVPVEAIDRVEVIRGPMSVMYGSGAFFGAINIITAKPSDPSRAQVYAGSVGSYGTYKGFLRLARQYDELSLVVNFGEYRTRGIKAPYDQMSTYSPVLTLASGLEEDATTENMLPNHERYFGVAGSFKNTTFDLSHSESRRGILDGDLAYRDGHRGNTKSSTAAVSHTHEFSPDVSLRTRLSYTQYDYEIDYSFSYDSAISRHQERSNGYEIEANLFVKPWSTLDLTLGANRRTVSLMLLDYDYLYFATGIIRMNPDDKFHTEALFSQADYSPVNWLRLVAGMRLERTTETGIYTAVWFAEDHTIFASPSFVAGDHKFEVIPRLAMIVSPNRGSAIKLLYGKAVKRPSLYQWYEGGIMGNELESASIETLELNYVASFSRRLMVNLSVFQNRLDNLLSRMNDLAFLRSTNAGKMKTIGIEAGLALEPMQNMNLHFSLCYQDSKNEESGLEDIELGYAPKVLGYGSVGYRLPHNISLAINGRYVGRMETKWDQNMVTPPSAQDPNGVWEWGRIGQPVDGYALFDLNVRADNLFSTGFFMGTRVTNLTDHEIRYPTTGSNNWADMGYLGPGRALTLTIGRQF